jgi:hypothetical protein
MGDEGKARKVLEKLVALSEETHVASQAILHFALEEGDKGFRALEKAYENRAIWSTFLKTDPLFDRVRSDPRYISLLKKMNLEP